MTNGMSMTGEGAAAHEHADVLDRLMSVTELERAQMAKLIHDDVLQSLGANLLKVQLCARLIELGRAEEGLQELVSLQADLGWSADRLRRLMIELQPLSDGGQELGEALRCYVQHLPGGENVAVGMQPGCEEQFAGWVANAFYRLAQTAVALAVSGLTGRSGWIGFSHEADRLSMVVVLDGTPQKRSDAAADARAAEVRKLLARRASGWGIDADIEGDNASGWRCTFSLRLDNAIG